MQEVESSAEGTGEAATTADPTPIPDQATASPAKPDAERPSSRPRRPRRPAADVAVRSDARQVAPSPVTDVVIRREGGPSEQRSTQCTVNVSASVRDRFSAYQLAKKLDRGSEPTNAVVIRRAVLNARKNDLFAQMLEYVRHSQVPHDDEDDDPEGLFGDVQGRRAERGRTKDTRQLPFRPSYEELAVIDALAAGYHFANRSEFLDAALDAFLPQLPDKRRR